METMMLLRSVRIYHCLNFAVAVVSFQHHCPSLFYCGHKAQQLFEPKPSNIDDVTATIGTDARLVSWRKARKKVRHDGRLYMSNNMNALDGDDDDDEAKNNDKQNIMYNNPNYNDGPSTDKKTSTTQDMSFWDPSSTSTSASNNNVVEEWTTREVAKLYFGETEDMEQQKENFVIQVTYPSLMNSAVVSSDLWDTPKVRRAILSDLFYEGGGDSMINTKKQQKTSVSSSSQPIATRTLSLSTNSNQMLIELEFLGVGTMPIPVAAGGGSNNEEIKLESRPCLFLRKRTNIAGSSTTSLKEALPIPMSNERYRQFLPLLVATHYNVPISKTKCLSLNSILINRDDGLFDNLPWKEWTILSSNDNRDFDATGKNRILKRFRTGKKDAFDRFMGKDWPGRSWSLGNLAQKALYEMGGGAGDGVSSKSSTTPSSSSSSMQQSSQRRNDSNDDSSWTKDDKKEQFDQTSLVKRVLELDLKEAKSELAEAEQILAIHVREHGRDVEPSELVPMSIDFVLQERLQYEQSLVNAQERIKQTTQALLELQGVNNDSDGSNNADRNSVDGSVVGGSTAGGITQLLQSIVERSLKTIDGKNNTAPYRGAYGYAPTIDTMEETSGKLINQVYPYTGPMDLLMELLQTQLRSTVVGTVLENTSLESSSQAENGSSTSVIQLGGAGVIQRRPPPKGSLGVTTVMGGEQVVDVPVESSKTELFNDEVSTGDVRIVECDTEEAVVLAMASNRPVSIDPILYESLSIPIRAIQYKQEGTKEGTEEALPWVVVDETSIKEQFMQNISTKTKSSQKQRPTPSKPSESNSDRRPQTTNALFARDGTGGSSSSSSMFASSAIVDKIQSVNEFDTMSINQKAKLLQETDSFKGKLPRPRVLRLRGEGSLPIDGLMLPLLDETIRKQILIREAERRGDVQIANALKAKRSKRHVAKDLAAASSDDERSQMWQNEADFAKSLRADVTQDEGSYSRFLDKDEWYERDRLARIKSMKKNTKSIFFNNNDD